MTYKSRGFTLIEIAIVLVIIGLLLGGVLKGQELITGARVRNLISQQDGIKAAFFGFQDRYRALPGDYAAATTTSAASVAANGNGNGRIEDDATRQAASRMRRSLAWNHLTAAGFMNGSYTMASSSVTDPDADNTPSNPYSVYRPAHLRRQLWHRHRRPAGEAQPEDRRPGPGGDHRRGRPQDRRRQARPPAASSSPSIRPQRRAQRRTASTAAGPLTGTITGGEHQLRRRQPVLSCESPRLIRGRAEPGPAPGLGAFPRAAWPMSKRSAGFTLVEMAIVLVIVGLLLGGGAARPGADPQRPRAQPHRRAGSGEHRHPRLPGPLPGPARRLPRGHDQPQRRSCRRQRQRPHRGHRRGQGIHPGMDAPDRSGFSERRLRGHQRHHGSGPGQQSDQRLRRLPAGNLRRELGPQRQHRRRHNIKTGNGIPAEILAEIDRKTDDGLPSLGRFQFSPYAGVGDPLEWGGNDTSCTTSDDADAAWNLAFAPTNCGAATLL